MSQTLSARETALCGLFGAAALLLPVLFHLVHLGHVFLPMYLPLLSLGFFVRPAAAAVTSAATPLLSAAVTGMPPLYPPVALLMSVELASMAALCALAVKRWPAVNEWLVLVPTLLVGRAVYLVLAVLFARIVELPASFVAGLSLLSAWPGLVLAVVVVPPVARLRRRSRSSHRLPHGEEAHHGR